MRPFQPKQILCKSEILPDSGWGVFYFAHSEALLPTLLETWREKIQLIYLDPPFMTGDTFYMRIDGEPLTTPAYGDSMGIMEYLTMMRSILGYCRELLRKDGSIYLHVDYRMIAPLRLMMDELFGEKCFQNEIIWAYHSGGRSTRHFSRKHDNILYYGKSPRPFFQIDAVGTPRGAERKNHMRKTIDSSGRVRYSINSAGKTYYYDEESLVYPSDVWMDIPHLHQKAPERNGYATQKPEALLSRIIQASSRPGDLVADFFSGSGTTAAVARKLGRRFLAADCSPYALHTIRRRLMESEAPSTGPFTLHYKEQSQDAFLTLSCSSHGDMFSFSNLRYCAGDTNTLLYMACGSQENDVFQAKVHQNRPSNSSILTCKIDKNPILHLVDTNGLQTFWEITPNSMNSK